MKQKLCPSSVASFPFRLGWNGFVSHPFWQGELQSLAVELENPAEEICTLRQSIRQSVLSTVQASTQGELQAALGQMQELNLDGKQAGNGSCN